MRDAVVQLIMNDLGALPRDCSIHLVVHGDGDVYPSEGEAWKRLWPR